MKSFNLVYYVIRSINVPKKYHFIIDKIVEVIIAIFRICSNDTDENNIIYFLRNILWRQNVQLLKKEHLLLVSN